MRPYVGLRRPLYNVKMMRMVERFFPDGTVEHDGDEIIIRTGTYVTGDPIYYRRRRAKEGAS